jgi:hypothetical protein
MIVLHPPQGPIRWQCARRPRDPHHHRRRSGQLIGAVAAEANHETNRRRQRRLDTAFNGLTSAADTLSE